MHAPRTRSVAYLVTAADKWTARDIEESHAFGCILPPLELFRCEISHHFHVSLRRAHVLAERYDVDVGFAQVCIRVSGTIHVWLQVIAERTAQRLHNLLVLLTQAQHYTCLRDSGAYSLCVLEDSK